MRSVTLHGGRCGAIYKHKALRWYACEGLIALHDESDHLETFKVFTPGEFRERGVALEKFAKKMPRTGMTAWQRQESQEMIRAAADMDASAKEAEEMGDPSNPTVQAWWQRHRRSSTISMSKATQASWSVGAPVRSLKEIAAAAKGNRTVNVPDESAPTIRQLPKKLPRPGKLILEL